MDIKIKRTPTILYYNHYHNGDIFINRTYVNHLSAQYNPKKVYYAHRNHESISRDLCHELVPSAILENINPLNQFLITQDEQILAVNTWVGAYASKYLTYTQHANFVILERIWREIFGRLGLELRGSYFDYLPRLKKHNFQTDFISRLSITNGFTKSILVCNNQVKSRQSNFTDLDDLTLRLANRFPTTIFFITQKICDRPPNVVEIADIIGTSTGNLCEISIASGFIDIIIGRNSGAFTFCHTHENVSDPNKIFVDLSNDRLSSLLGEGNYPCRHFFSSSVDVDYVTWVLKSELQRRADKMVTQYVPFANGNSDPFLNRRTVLLITNEEHKCGISQYGRILGEILNKSEHYYFITHALSNEAEVLSVVHKHRPSIMIFNHSNTTMGWLSDEFIQLLSVRLDVKSIIITGHEQISHFRHASVHLSSDPCTHPKFGLLPAPPPILYLQNIRYTLPQGELRIGTSGFINPLKNIPKLIGVLRQRISGKFILRLHLSSAVFVSNTDEVRRDILESCSRLTDEFLSLEVIESFFSYEEHIAWLNSNDLNVFYYESNPEIGASASVYRAIAARKPFVVNNASLFRHVYCSQTDLNQDLTKLVFEGNNSHSLRFEEIWSETNLIAFYEALVGRFSC